MRLIDTHCHLWKRKLSKRTWLTPALGVLYRTFGVDDLEDATGEVGTVSCVLIEAGKSPEENRLLQHSAKASSSIKAFVSYADLGSPDLARDLDLWQRDPKFRGVRMGLEGADATEMLNRPSVLDGLREVARRGLIFEFLAQTHQLKDVIAVCNKVPELKGIIEHMGKPDLTDKKDLSQWKEYMSILAKDSPVTCKLSFSPRGQDFMSLLANPEGALSPDLIEPHVVHLLEHFGAKRLMWGSDWPICLLFGGYSETWDIFDETISRFTMQDKTRIFGGNAVAFYGLDHQEHGGS